MGLKDYIDDHIRDSQPSSISALAPYSAIILSIVLVVLFLIRFYILRSFLLPRLYGAKYTEMDYVNRRSFLNNHIAGATKLLLLIIGIYLLIGMDFGGAHFHSPFVHGSRVTMGDLLIIASQMLTGMFIFELIYHAKIPPVSVAHHIGGIMVGQVAVTMSVKGDQV